MKDEKNERVEEKERRMEKRREGGEKKRVRIEGRNERDRMCWVKKYKRTYGGV